MTITGVGAGGTVTGVTGVWSCGSSSVIVWQATTVRPTSTADHAKRVAHCYPLDWT